MEHGRRDCDHVQNSVGEVKLKMTKTDRKLQEIIGFFESEDGYEKAG
jgi:hypothetical protein